MFFFIASITYLDTSGEGERESEWLSEAGLGHLSVAFKEGRELDQDALRPTLEGLNQLQALAVSRRIHTLNRTVRKRHKRQPRAKLTQIFPNFEVLLTKENNSYKNITQYTREVGKFFNFFFCLSCLEPS